MRWISLGFLCMFLAGCSSEPEGMLQGKVLFDGEPLPNVAVIFTYPIVIYFLCVAAVPEPSREQPVDMEAFYWKTRRLYYAEHGFADVFATLTRAPRWVEARVQEMPGGAIAEARIAKNAILDIEGMSEPATGLVQSLPDHKAAVLNRPYLRAGRLPEPEAAGEVTVNEAFANAHAMRIGDGFDAILNGRKRHLVIVGIALSPDEKTLYVAVSDPQDTRVIAYDLATPAAASRVVFNAQSLKSPQRKGGCDGMKVDAQGNIWTTGPGGVLILDKNGKHLGSILTGQATANCAWGGEDRSTLYITADMFLLRVKTKTRGS